MNDALAIVLNAISNSSREAVSTADVQTILATGDGPGHLVRALYGDCSFETLDRAAAALGLSRAILRKSYTIAKQRHAARNSELDNA